MNAAAARAIEDRVFAWRRPILVLSALVTLVLGHQAMDLRIDAGFDKLLPKDHPYTANYLDHRGEFGGANRLLIAVRARDGDIFTAPFFETLKQVSDAVFFLPGVDRSSVRSLFTPNVRFVEVVEGGFVGGNVVPAGFRPTAAGLARIRENVLKADLVGRLVADDFSAALVTAELIERDPVTGERLDYLDVARRLETEIRARFVDEATDIHILGFARAVGDIAEGAEGVAWFFALTFVCTALLVLLFTRSLRLTLLGLGCSLVAVIWTIGGWTLLDFGLDPLSVLVPFLIFAVGVSHAVQMINQQRAERPLVADRGAAARQAFRLLLLPGGAALASDVIGFLTILLIGVRMIQELALMAALGITLIAVTNLILLPLLLSIAGPTGAPARPIRLDPVWRALASCAAPRGAAICLLGALALLGLGLHQARHLTVGDPRPGVPELRPDSRYNTDARLVAEHFAIGVDVLQVIVETEPDACVDHAIMAEIDRFQWHLANLPGVRSTLSLPQLAKLNNAGWNEGDPKWRVLPHHPASLAQAVAPIETSSGLLNGDCSVMPVVVFAKDHRAETIDRLIAAVKDYRPAAAIADRLTFRLASGNLGVMAATNQVVAAAQVPILLYVYGAVIAMCLLTFRSVTAVLCIVLPLGLVSVLVYALMSLLGIGLKLSTLPVAALGVGIGVDYGIYMLARLREHLAEGLPLRDAYRKSLGVAGSAVLVTGLTLALGVAGWVLSDLQFQADMGLLLAFMFLANMLGALMLLPAILCIVETVSRWWQPR